MPNEMTKEHVIELARSLGAALYTKAPTRSIVGLSFTYTQLETFAALLFKEGRRSVTGEQA